MTEPQSDRPTSLRRGGWLLIAFGAVTLVHWLVASYSLIGQSLVDLAFAIGLLACALLVSRGLGRRAPWAWWAGLALTAAGLFFTAPITGTILLGGGAEPIGTGWDVFYFPFTTLLLLALLTTLVAGRGELEPSP